jgi:uncharacterized protein
LAKILLLIAVGAAVYFIVRGYARSVSRARDAESAGPAADAHEDMVRCTHCGVHLPRSESSQVDGGFFCSEEHRRLHRHDK